MPTAGIAGAGLIGRMIGLELARRGWGVHLFDRDDRRAASSCTYASAGMLAPSCELESAEREISAYGLASLAMWPAVLEQIGGNVDFRHRGSLVVAHPNDRDELLRLKTKVLSNSPEPDVMEEVSAARIAEIEPSLAGRFQDGLYFRREGHVDNRAVLEALAETLASLGVTWSTGVEVGVIAPGKITSNGDSHTFDWAIDTRGFGARHDLKDLRGIRGELLYVHAPEVDLGRPIRLMHPRYPIYIVPRPDHLYVVGATAIESEDLGPITVRSTLELLSAAYTVHTGFAEARLVETITNCRPAFPDNRPRIYHARGMLRVNGLYRHGFLISPLLARFAVDFMENGEVDPRAGEIMVPEEASPHE